MGAHTPGPWSIKDGMIVAPPDDPTEYYEEQIGVVYRTEAWTSGEPVETEDQANARLIASAPDLLAAAKLQMQAHAALDNRIGYGKWQALETKAINALSAAIAKAEGSE